MSDMKLIINSKPLYCLNDYINEDDKLFLNPQLVINIFSIKHIVSYRDIAKHNLSVSQLAYNICIECHPYVIKKSDGTKDIINHILIKFYVVDNQVNYDIILYQGIYHNNNLTDKNDILDILDYMLTVVDYEDIISISCNNDLLSKIWTHFLGKRPILILTESPINN